MTIVMIMMIISFGLVLYLYVMRGDKKNGRSDKSDEWSDGKSSYASG